MANESEALVRFYCVRLTAVFSFSSRLRAIKHAANELLSLTKCRTGALLVVPKNNFTIIFKWILANCVNVPFINGPFLPKSFFQVIWEKININISLSSLIMIFESFHNVEICLYLKWLTRDRRKLISVLWFTQNMLWNMRQSLRSGNAFDKMQ